MNDVFAIGDIHGELNRFKALLRYWRPDREQLVLTGDLVDRGEDSYGVIRLARKLQEEYGAIVIGGNHDSMLLDWLSEPMGDYLDVYYPQGGMQTIHSFFEKNVCYHYLPDYIASLMKKQFPTEIEFLKNLPNYYEHGDYVFVHAGVNLAYSNWKNSSENEFRWIRTPFHYGRNDTDKIFVFGHTVTRNLNPDKSDDIWISPCGTKIGIDGGAVFNGLLHGLRIKSNDEYELYSVDKTMQMRHKEFSLTKLVTK